MRIVSLLPSTTEIVCALGLSDALVAVTHECDYPLEVLDKPIITRSSMPHTGLTSAEIDTLVTAQVRDQLSIYALDEQLLATLQPDLILTQALCEVCAVAFNQVQRAVRDLGAVGNLHASSRLNQRHWQASSRQLRRSVPRLGRRRGRTP